MPIQTIYRGVKGDSSKQFTAGAAFDAAQANDEYLDAVNTVADLSLLSLSVGDVKRTKGLLSIGDGNQGTYIVEAASGTPDGVSRVLLANGNHAVLPPARVNGDLTLNKAIGQTSIWLQQASVTNGRLWASGGAGTDVNLAANRFLNVYGEIAIRIFIDDVQKIDVTPSGTDFLYPVRFLNSGNAAGAVTPMSNYSCVFEADPGSLGDTSTYLNLNVQDSTILQLKSGSAEFFQPVACDTLTVNGGIVLGTSLTNTSTPVASGASTAGSGTYSQQLGLWTRYGNAVHFTLYIYWTAHTGTGQIRISLPFTSNASAPPVSCTIDVAGGALLTSDAVFKALISPNTNYIKISKYVPSTGSDAVVNMTASAIITISGTFFV